MNIHQTIKELEAKKAQIETAIASLKALNGITPSARQGTQNGETILSATMAHLRRVGTHQSSQQLREAIREAGVGATSASIQTILSRRARLKKDLRHIGRGKWGLRK